MRGISLFVACVVLLEAGFIHAGPRPPPTKVTVAVYYECMCPFSINFITTQLWPTYVKLSRYMKVSLYPYGNAHRNNITNENGTVTEAISCQHGENECKGNIVQACALALYRRTSIQVSFVSCMMSAALPYRAGQQCAARIGLEWGLIKKCAVSAHGKTLLIEMGYKTSIEYVTSVPHIVVNGIFSDEYTRLARTNFMSLICSLLKVKPRLCTKDDKAE
ncbi:gamma-interferon-inducible lysosomal thiol reductase-like [Ornithodoros turicata]|uniref:gamma-interferon-inducible lysosomal thiol reductase-like n=1 Tax=Ornithodoros turicata TaxID=34597 RepID=UPI00313A405C